VKETIERKIMRYIAKVGQFIDENDVVYPALCDFGLDLRVTPDMNCGVEWEDLSDEFLEELVA
jgi:hypothetical protein